MRGDLLIDSTPVAHREDPDHAFAPVDGVDEPIPSHAELPEPFEIPPKRFADGGILRDCAKGRFDPAFDLWGQVTNDPGHVGRDFDPTDGHYRVRRLGGTSRSPNTSSNDRPRRAAA